MKKLSYEDGHIVIRNMDGTLFWSSHWGEMKGSYVGKPDPGGYKEILIEGTLFEKSLYCELNKQLEL